MVVEEGEGKERILLLHPYVDNGIASFLLSTVRPWNYPDASSDDRLKDRIQKHQKSQKHPPCSQNQATSYYSRWL